MAAAVDWSFLDAVYIITCPSADGNNPRLQRARETLAGVGLDSITEVREFEADNEDHHAALESLWTGPAPSAMVPVLLRSSLVVRTKPDLRVGCEQ